MKAIRFLVSLCTYNFPTKALSLFLAIAVWYGLDAEITDRTQQEVTLTVRLVNKRNWEILEGESQTVVVSLKGPRSDIARVADMVIRDRLQGLYTIDERTIETQSRDPGVLEEVHTVTITAACFNLQFREVVFERIKPSRIHVKLVRMGVKELRVKPVLVGDPEAGHVRQKVKVTPSKVSVRGPRVVLDRHEEIDTDPVFVYGRDEPFEEVVGVVTHLGGFPVRAARRVTVQVVISRKPGEKVVERVPIRVIYPQSWNHEAYRVEINERLDVTLRGPAEYVDKMTPDDLLLTAELDTSAYDRWMDAKSDTQDAMARLRCVVVGPSTEAQRQVAPQLQNQGVLRFTVVRKKAKKK